MNLNFNFTGKTTLKDWWKIVKDNFTKIVEGFDTHTSAKELDHPDLSVRQRHIANQAVGTNQIADKAVTTNKIADSAITKDKLAESSITSGKLTTYCVTSMKIEPNSVQTTHIVNGNVTKEKLATDVQNQLDAVQDYMDNGAKTVRDGSITEDKINSLTMGGIRNYCLADKTYDATDNDFDRATGGALCYSFSSRLGELKHAPWDETGSPDDGTVHYIVFVIPYKYRNCFQLAINISSMRRFGRMLGTYDTDWIEMK